MGKLFPAARLIAFFRPQHIPPQGAHLIRYYGWYSNKARGLRCKAAEAAAAAVEPAAASSSGDAGPIPACSRSSRGS